MVDSWSAVCRERSFSNNNPISVSKLAGLMIYRSFPIVPREANSTTYACGCNQHDDGSNEKSHGFRQAVIVKNKTF
jgi:hypothetical protein